MSVNGDECEWGGWEMLLAGSRAVVAAVRVRPTAVLVSGRALTLAKSEVGKLGCSGFSFASFSL